MSRRAHGILEAPLAAQRFIDEGLAGVALAIGRELWIKDHDTACMILELAYRALGRDPLAEVARVHRLNPGLPSVNILDYKRGDYTSVAEALANANEVRKLELGGHGLVTMPDLSSLGALEELLLWGNELEAIPQSLESCTALRRINLFRNSLRSFPVGLASLPKLEELILSRNQISSIGEEISLGEHLRQLDLNDNQLVALPEGFGSSGSLAHLGLADNPLSALPESLGTLSSLRRISLQGCKLQSLPTDLSGWKDLEFVSLGGNPLPDAEIDRLRKAAPEADVTL